MLNCNAVVWEHVFYIISVHVNPQHILIMVTVLPTETCDRSLCAQRRTGTFGLAHVNLSISTLFPFAGYFNRRLSNCTKTVSMTICLSFCVCFLHREHTWGNPSLHFNWKQHVWLGCLTPTSFCRPWCVFCTLAFAAAHPSEPIEQPWTLMKQIPWTVTQKSNVRKKNLWCSGRRSLTAKFIYLETARKDILITYTHAGDSKKKNG